MPEHQESGDEKAEADGEQGEGRAGGPRQQEVWCDRGDAKSDLRDILRPLCNILEPPPTSTLYITSSAEVHFLIEMVKGTDYCNSWTRFMN